MQELRTDQSSNITQLTYDPTKNTLLVWFKSRKHDEDCYSYENVTSDIWLQLITAASLGSTFHKLIRSHPEKFPYTTLERGLL